MVFLLRSTDSEPRPSHRRWQADYSLLASPVADELEEALTYADEHYADLSGLEIGPQEMIATPGVRPNEQHMMTTYGTPTGARGIGYDPLDMGSMERIERQLARQRVLGYLTIPDAQGMAWHEVGHVVRRRNPQGDTILHAMLKNVGNALNGGTLTEDELRLSLGTYGLSSEEELFAEAYRLHHTLGLPSSLSFLTPLFGHLAAWRNMRVADYMRQQYSHHLPPVGPNFPTFRSRLVHVLGASLTPPRRKGVRDLQAEKREATRVRDRARAVNPLLGEYSLLPLSVEAERRRVETLSPDARARYEAIVREFDRKEEMR